MINIVVWSATNVTIEQEDYPIANEINMVAFLTELLNRAFYSGETICLETARIDPTVGKAFFTEVERWYGSTFVERLLRENEEMRGQLARGQTKTDV